MSQREFTEKTLALSLCFSHITFSMGCTMCGRETNLPNILRFQSVRTTSFRTQ